MYNLTMTIKNIKYIIYFIFISLFISAVPAEAGCTKTIQHRNYDARGKLTGFIYEKVYSNDCSFYASKTSSKSVGRRK